MNYMAISEIVLECIPKVHEELHFLLSSVPGLFEFIDK